MFESLDLQIMHSHTEIKTFENKNYEYIENIKLNYVKSLVLLIISEYEIIIEKIFYLRAVACDDYMLANFVKSQVDKKFRSPDLTKITSTLKKFDETLSEEFQRKITNTPIHTRWDNLMKARHYIVHRSGNLNLTYEELLLSYDETKKVLYELASILNVDMQNNKSI